MVRRWIVLLSCLAATAAGAVGVDQRVRESRQRLHPQQASTQRQVPAIPRRALPPVAATDALGASYTYDAVGNRATATYPNGLVTHYTYDPLDRLVELHTVRDGATVQRYRFTLDRDGARRRIDATDTDGASHTTDYAYDHGRRLVEERQYRNGVREIVATYRYDAVGNRTQATVNGITTDYVYNANDWLVSETANGGAASGTIAYTYDANGNRTGKSGPMGAVAYVYDDANRLVEMRSAGDVVTYRYAHTGLLLEKTWTPAVGPATSWRYVWDVARGIPQTIEEHTRVGPGAFALSATYLFGDDLIAQTRDGETRYVLADGLGDTRALADTGGSVTDTFSYDAWGNVLRRTGESPVDHLYRGERFDPNLGFYDLRARYMDPSIGRFTSLDPASGNLFDPPSLHKYLYTPADPVNHVDPTGRSYVGAVSFAATLSMAALSTVNTTIALYDFASGNRELSVKEVGLAILWAYAGSKAGPLFGRLEQTLRRAGCLDNSFAKGTLVETARGLRRIEELGIGDTVLSRDVERGIDEYRAVTAVTSSTKRTALVAIELADGTTIEATPDHRLHADGGWKEARHLQVGSALSTASGRTIAVRALRHTVREETVYDLTVERNANFYVSTARVLAHNMSPCEKVAQALVKALPSTCRGNTRCVEFAMEFEKVLVRKGMKGKRLCLRTLNGVGAPFSDRHGMVGTNEFHYGIQVGDLVFDNNWTEGISLRDWIKDFGGPQIVGVPGSGAALELYEHEIGSAFRCN